MIAMLFILTDDFFCLFEAEMSSKERNTGKDSCRREEIPRERGKLYRDLHTETFYLNLI